MRLQTAAELLRLYTYLLLLAPRPPAANTIGLERRLAAFPVRDLLAERPVEIRWNAHQVPFIQAETDRDLAVALGLVHAHLRLGQMEVLRRVAHGRLSELAGPAALDLDYTLRILDLGYAVPAIVQRLPADTRAWLEGFVAGINRYLLDDSLPLPHEFALFGLKREPWRIEDILTLGRLVSADITWLAWLRLLPMRDSPGWSELWARLIQAGRGLEPDIAPSGPIEEAAARSILGANTRGGSNCLAVSRERSLSGSAWLAGDPHLGISLPSNWLIAGCKSPGYHAVGLMIPGLPFLAIGRNPWIAWGGTNLHAAASELDDVSDIPESALEVREETIAARWGKPRRVTIRRLGARPILSDSPFFRSRGARLALSWVGHSASDEITAMLGVNRAKDWAGFAAALDGFAVPGQNMIYADTAGSVGHALAAWVPKDLEGAPQDLVMRGHERDWSEFITTRGLPSRYRPATGFVVSANDKPPDTEIVVGRMFSSPARRDRISTLLQGWQAVGFAEIAALQRDVTAPPAAELAGQLARAALGGSVPLDPRSSRIVALLENWDGTYSDESQAPAAFELLLFHFAKLFYPSATAAAYAASWALRDLIADDLRSADPDHAGPVVRRALRLAAKSLGRRAWGQLHRLRLGHALGALPIVGRRYTFCDLPTPGGSETIMKAANSLTAQRHSVGYGSNARYIFDMSDPDGAHLLLLGGQDGWFGSMSFADQVPLWRRGAYIRMPLGPEMVRDSFPFVTTLSPARD